MKENALKVNNLPMSREEFREIIGGLLSHHSPIKLERPAKQLSKQSPGTYRPWLSDDLL